MKKIFVLFAIAFAGFNSLQAQTKVEEQAQVADASGKLHLSKALKMQGPTMTSDLFTLESYTVTIIKGGEEFSFPIKGPFINSNPSAVKAMHELKAGDRLYFEDIVVMGPEKKLRNLPALSFVLIN